MHVNGGEAIAQAKTAQNMEENDGIAATGKANPEAFIRRETGGEKGADPFLKIS
jgi:hypothetical protein